MDFKKLRQAGSADERKACIEEQVCDEAWADYLTDLPHGGYPDDINIYEIEIDESDETFITVDVKIDFKESVPSSCHDINYGHNATAEFRIQIERSDGAHEIDDGESDVDDDFEIHNDTRPDDYL